MHQPSLFSAPALQPVTVGAIEPHGIAIGLFWRVAYMVGDQVVGYGIIGASTVAKARRSARQIAAGIPAAALPEAVAAAQAA